MKTYKNFVNELSINVVETEEEIERQFVQFAHLNELEIKFDLIKYDDNLFYFYNTKFMFEKFYTPDDELSKGRIDICYDVYIKISDIFKWYAMSDVYHDESVLKRTFLNHITKKYFGVTGLWMNVDFSKTLSQHIENNFN